MVRDRRRHRAGDGKLTSMVAWLWDDGGDEHLLCCMIEGSGGVTAVPLIAFDRKMEDWIDERAKEVVAETGRPARKVEWIRGQLLGELNV